MITDTDSQTMVLFPEASPVCLGNTLQYIGEEFALVVEKKPESSEYWSKKQSLYSRFSPDLAARVSVCPKEGSPEEAELHQLDDFIHYKGLYRSVFGYIRGRIRDSHDAEDIMQSVMMNLVNGKLTKYDPTRSFKSWIFTVATNQYIDHTRRNKRHKAVSLDEGTERYNEEGSESCSHSEILLAPEDNSVEYNENSDFLHRAVDQLPLVSREVVELVHLQGFKYREAGDIIGIPQGTVKSRMHKALEQLKRNPFIGKLEDSL